MHSMWALRAHAPGLEWKSVRSIRARPATLTRLDVGPTSWCFDGESPAIGTQLMAMLGAAEKEAVAFPAS